jgi:hypothetical protein
MFSIELGLPFFIFAPRRLRMGAGLVMMGFQLLIMATGNYNFFNLLAIALCLTLFDDPAFRAVKPHFRLRRVGKAKPFQQDSSRNWPSWLLIPVSVFLFLVS